MNWFPIIPGWDGIHPAMVMFPIVLLLATPLLLLTSLFAREAWRGWAGAALVTMVLGTLAAWLAVGSGHAAGQLVDKTRELEAAILRHESLGVNVRTDFTGLTTLNVALLLLPRWIKRPIPAALRNGVLAVFLAGYVTATGIIAHAADAGGRLVHQQGVRALVDAPVASITKAPAAATPTPVPRAPVPR